MNAWDPTGKKARAVKTRYVGVCRGCGAYTQPRSGKGDAYAYWKACHPGAVERRWAHERVIDSMLDWRSRHGTLPTSYDWSRTHVRRRGGDPFDGWWRGTGPRRALSPHSLAPGRPPAHRRSTSSARRKRAGSGRSLIDSWGITPSGPRDPGDLVAPPRDWPRTAVGGPDQRVRRPSIRPDGTRPG